MFLFYIIPVYYYHVFYFYVHTTITTTAIIITTDFMEIEWNFLLHSNGPLQPELLSLAFTYCRVVMPPPPWMDTLYRRYICSEYLKILKLE